MEKNHRRDFLKKSLAGLCGAAAIPGTLKASLGQAGAKPAAAPSLPSRTLGRTGIKTPLISLGCGESATPHFIRMAYDAGVKLFFSATYYGRGNNERLVGEALKDVPRDSYIVGTAAAPEGFDPRAGAVPKDMTAQAYMKTAEESLKRFGLDHVDFLLLPFADKKEYVTFAPFLEALAELKKQGKTRFAGIATHGASEEVLKAAAEAKVYDVVMAAYNYKVENKDAVNKALADAAKAGLGIVAMKTTAGAARDKTRTKPLNIGAAMKWVLQNQDVSSIVSGMSSVEQLQMNLEMIKSLKMSEQEMKDLNLANLRSEPSLYCLQCRKCLPQCPNSLDIPTLMRGYMYAYGYRNAEQAWHTVNAVAVSGRPCDKCEICGVACTAGFDIKDRVQDILRLKDVPVEFLKG